MEHRRDQHHDPGQRPALVLPVAGGGRPQLEPERCLALTESATGLADKPDPVSDEVGNEAAKHYDEPALASLLIEIATINAFNRLSLPTHQRSGQAY
jgi:alkylhydroperoxidase family enzyme